MGERGVGGGVLEGWRVGRLEGWKVGLSWMELDAVGKHPFSGLNMLSALANWRIGELANWLIG